MVRVSSAPSSFACICRLRLPISSRNSVPPVATSKRPARSSRASVNAPLLDDRTAPTRTASRTPRPDRRRRTPDRAAGSADGSRAPRAPCPCRSRRGSARSRPWPRPCRCAPAPACRPSDAPTMRSKSWPMYSLSERWRRRRFASFAIRARQPRDRGDGGHELGVVPGLHHEVRGAFAHRVDRRFDVAVGGHQDHVRIRRERLRRAQPVQPFGARRHAGGEVHVEQQHVERLLLELLPDLRRIRRRHDDLESASSAPARRPAAPRDRRRR